MINVIDLPVPVELSSGRPVSLGHTDKLRPKVCPGCKHPARDREHRLVLHAHGSYLRQVLGLVASKVLYVWIPRFLCRLCSTTISILPAWLHPSRWYSIVAVVETLWLWSTGQATIKELRARFAAWPEGDGWRSVRRWAGDFLVRPTLLGWMRLPASATTRLGDRLHRFLFHVRPAGPATALEWTAGEVRACGREALAGTCHRPLSSPPVPVTSAPGIGDASPGTEPDAVFPHRRALLAS